MDAKQNPILDLTPAQIDVLDDMLDEWRDRDRHGQLNGGYGYGPAKTIAFYELDTLIHGAWLTRVNYRNVETDPPTVTRP